MLRSNLALNRLRKLAAVILLIGLFGVSIASGFSQLRNAANKWSFAGDLLDDPIKMANRLKLLEARLPAYGTIGYLSERDVAGWNADPIDQDEEFVMTQYALAPRIIERGAGPALVIVNLPYQTPAEMERVISPFHLKLVEKFDFGLYLYQH